MLWPRKSSTYSNFCNPPPISSLLDTNPSSFCPSLRNVYLFFLIYQNSRDELAFYYHILRNSFLSTHTFDLWAIWRTLNKFFIKCLYYKLSEQHNFCYTHFIITSTKHINLFTCRFDVVNISDCLALNYGIINWKGVLFEVRWSSKGTLYTISRAMTLKGQP